MYPAQLFSFFPPFPREQRVFVVMSFDERFNFRWDNVIAPGVKECGLLPFRVDSKIVGDSILTEILTGISNSQLVFVDLSTLGGCRNGNVMYELGLAHAVRQPQEVLLFRSDSDKLLFDITQVRVNSYKPDEQPEKAKRQVSNAVKEAIREIDLTQSLSVSQLLESLSYWECVILMELATRRQIPYPTMNSLGEVIQQMSRIPAIVRLLQLGVLRNVCPRIERQHLQLPVDTRMEDLFGIELTPLGQAVSERMNKHMVGALSQEDVRSYAEGYERHGAKNVPVGDDTRSSGVTGEHGGN